MTYSSHQRMSKDEKLPLLPLRDVVVFPGMVAPLFVGRPESVTAVRQALLAHNNKIILLTQKDVAINEPQVEDLYKVGCVGVVLQLLHMPDGVIKLIVEGKARVQLTDTKHNETYLCSYFQYLHNEVQDLYLVSPENIDDIKQAFAEYARHHDNISTDTHQRLAEMQDISSILDTIAAHLDIEIGLRQQILESVNVNQRVELIIQCLKMAIDLQQLDEHIHAEVKKQMEKNQRDYYLNEQMKAIQKELGEDALSEYAEIETAIKNAKMPAAIFKRANNELRKMRLMPAMSAEATVVRNYLDWFIHLPWHKRSDIQNDLEAAESVLEANHYGLEKVKERIIEYLAVLQLVRAIKGPILCLVGPPGVGKTSLGKSIAEATKRHFVRMSLGGVRDEAEIRGHRRTYIGALPGKVIQAMKKAEVKNPLILLDEVDKMGADVRGDPASALLEVLDHEQNHSFNDHYMEVDYDLSEVMFITTANSLNIPAPLLDRMELIRIPGYTEQEKLEIARRYLLPENINKHGLDIKKVAIDDDILIELIRYHTREAGVRHLDRELAALCRKAARLWLANKQQVKITCNDLETHLGARRFRFGLAEKEDAIGVVTGLAWTETGGDLLQIETVIMPGKGTLSITGQLGDVMQESVQAAFAYVRARAVFLGLKSDFHKNVDIHVHVPEGAIPKDGPSAGLAMAVAMVSSLTGISVRKDVCMTGEMTLRGKALPIGGLKEKLLAAHRGGMRVVLIPMENKRNLRDIPEEIKQNLEIKGVENVDEVLLSALTRLPSSLNMSNNALLHWMQGIRMEEDAKPH
ncbi:MAG: endopeptidase La [Mariprofundales bacterium]